MFKKYVTITCNTTLKLYLCLCWTLRCFCTKENTKYKNKSDWHCSVASHGFCEALFELSFTWLFCCHLFIALTKFRLFECVDRYWYKKGKCVKPVMLSIFSSKTSVFFRCNPGQFVYQILAQTCKSSCLLLQLDLFEIICFSLLYMSLPLKKPFEKWIKYWTTLVILLHTSLYQLHQQKKSKNTNVQSADIWYAELNNLDLE